MSLRYKGGVKLSDEVSKSWFCVFNNPEEHGFDFDPQEICDRVVNLWVDGFPTRSCAVIYCISVEGLKHLHVVLEDSKAMRFSAVKKVFPSMHIEPTKGNKEQAEDYIKKRGRWQEKGEQVLCSSSYGEIKGCQGARRDFEVVDELIKQGLTPGQIFDMNFAYRRYESMIKSAFFRFRASSVAVKRHVNVYWHVGESGSGKTYSYVEDCERLGEENVYLLNDYDNGGFDLYCAQSVLYMDEFRGQMKWSVLMNYLDGYKVQVHCRYGNGVALWDEVHITTVLPPEMVYKNMVDSNRGLDTYEQLRRRITAVVYHWFDNATGEYKKYALPMSQYVDYDNLKTVACSKILENGFFVLPDAEPNPFQFSFVK